MSVVDIIQHPNDLLREVAVPVTAFDSDLQDLIRDLRDSLTHYGGIGLSAPQIGELKRVALVHVPDDEYGEQVYINPEILWTQRLGLVEESCLSVPGVVGNVFRATCLRVKAVGPSGEVFESTVDGMHAVCLQHECDHLDGKLFVDRLSWFKRLRLQWAERRAAKAAHPAPSMP